MSVQSKLFFTGQVDLILILLMLPTCFSGDISFGDISYCGLYQEKKGTMDLFQDGDK